MKSGIWISTLLVGVLALAGAAAAGDHPKGGPGGPRDAAGMSGPRWDGGGYGQGYGQGGQAGCCMPMRSGRGGGKGPRAEMGPGMGRGGMRPGMAPGAGSGAGPRGAGAMAPRGGMGSGPGGGSRGGPGLGMMRQLDLTPAQREKFAGLHERTMKQNIQAGADLRIARMDLAKQMRAGTPDGRAIDAQIDKIAGLRAGIQKSRVAALLEARSLLTPEQQKKLHELRAQMHPGMGPGAGGGRRMMGGQGGYGGHGGHGGRGAPGDPPDPPDGDDK